MPQGAFGFLFFHDSNADDYGLVRFVNRSIRAGLDILADRIHKFHAGGDPAERCIFSVKFSIIRVHDKELRARGVHCLFGADEGGFAQSCHGKDAARMRKVVFNAIIGKFAGNGIRRAARPVAVRVAALDHKAGDDAMERESIVKAFFRKLDKILYRDRCDRFVQRDRDDAVAFYCCLLYTSDAADD